MRTPKRARRGTATDDVGIFVKLPPDLFDAYTATAAERGITRRQLVIAGLTRELADPTVFADDQQEELPLKTA